ncbi:MAG TPA: serine/threonine-protein kinase [Ktedonobacteraceae bacterium]|jgi:serine/threonine protein kinase
MQEMRATLPSGSIVGNRYQIEALLGKGGFGAVYLVRDLRVQQNVFALKEIIDLDQRRLRHFALEAEFLKRADHPSLPRVYRIFDDPLQQRAYMLMDYIEGANLERLRRERPGQRLPLEEVLRLMQPVVEAVAYLHRQRPPIVHRDIKPSNIIASVSDGPTVLVDLGIAKEFDQDATTTAIRHASPGYGAPEQYSAGTNPRTDIYGLGATLYALLTGTVPADAFFRLTQHLSRERDSLVPVQQLVPTLPDGVAAAIERALALESEQRFASVEDFWQALQAGSLDSETQRTTAQSASSVRLVRNGQVRAQHTPAARRRWVALCLLLLFVCAISITSALLLFPGLRGQQSRAPTMLPLSQSATHTTSTPAVQPDRSPRATQAPSLPATATPAPVVMHLASTYRGSIHDNDGDLDASLSLEGIVQQQQHVRGNFIVSLPLSGSGPFSGVLGANQRLQFTVHSAQVQAPLYFSGSVEPGGTISGTYCSLDSTGQCNPDVGGYGDWSVQAGSIG